MENSELLTTELHMDAEHPEVSGGFLYSLVLWETGFVCFSGFASIVYACDAVILKYSRPPVPWSSFYCIWSPLLAASTGPGANGKNSGFS